MNVVGTSPQHKKKEKKRKKSKQWYVYMTMPIISKWLVFENDYRFKIWISISLALLTDCVPTIL